jgi:hypothetical protein
MLHGRHRSLLMLLFAAMTMAWPHTAMASDWVDQRESGPFLCRAEFPLDRIDGLLHELEKLQADLVRCLGVPPAEEPIELYFFRDKWSYSAYLKKHLPQVPYRRALYVKHNGPGRVYSYRSSEFEIDVRHECTHALLHSVLPVVPLWLDEGLAEYFELPEKQRAFGSPYLNSLAWNLRLGIIPKLENLEKLSAVSDMGKSQYRDAWAWVHFMFHGPREAHAELGRFLQDFRDKSPPGLLSQRLERRIPGARRRLVAHFKGWKR